MKSVISVVILFICSVFSCYAVDVTEAQKFYTSGKYTDAVRIYKDVIAQHGDSPEILYDLGNAAVKAGNYGEAVLAYKKALLLDPSDGETRGNLEYALSKVEDRNRSMLKGRPLSVERDRGPFFSVFLVSVTNLCSPDKWGILAIVSFILLITGALIYIMSENTVLRKIGFFGGGVFLLMSIVFNFLAFIGRSYANDHSECVITEYRTVLAAEPSPIAKEVATPLSAGTVMYILDKKKDEDGEQWYKVRLNDDFIGWIRNSSVAVL